MAGACSVYIYYRVAAAQQAAAREAVGALQAALAAHSGIQGRLLRRTEDAETWMEIYEPLSELDAFLAQLHSAEQAVEIAALIQDGKRHLESFQAL
jgi:Domain of unknown function (DUF4936)